MTVTCKGWSARNLRWAVEPSGSLMRMAAMSGCLLGALPAGLPSCLPFAVAGQKPGQSSSSLLLPALPCI
jgi:hypothetical protein